MGRFSVAAWLRPNRTDLRVRPTKVAPVEVQIMGRGRLDVLRARNVSETGIGVYVPHGFEGCDLDEEVGLVLSFPGQRAFLARGIIKHRTDGGHEGHHFGLHFTKISRAHRAIIRAFVAAMQGR